jgi:hypothetical protein
VEYYNGLVTTYETELSTAMTQVVAMCGKDDNKTFLAWMSQWNAVSQIQDQTARANAEAAFAASFTAFWGSYTGTSSSDPLSFAECGGMISSLLQDSQLEGSTVLANLQSTLVSLKATVQPLVSTSYGTDRYQREQAVNTAITALKAQNKATREAKEKEIAEEYRNAENEAWNEYQLQHVAAKTELLTDTKNSESEFQNEVKAANEQFDQTVVPVWDEYVNNKEEQYHLYHKLIQEPLDPKHDCTAGCHPKLPDMSSNTVDLLQSAKNTAWQMLPPTSGIAIVVNTWQGGETVYSNSRAADYSIGYSLYTAGGTGLARVTGVENLSYAIDGLDPVSGETYSGGWRATYTALGVGQLITTALGIKAGGTNATTRFKVPVNPSQTPSAVITEGIENLKPSVATETVQQTAKPLVNSEIVTPNYPQGTTTILDTSLFTTESTNLVSPQRTIHILTGDKTGGGHLFPGNPGKTPFPKDWSPSKIMDVISDIVTDPNNVWKQDKGILGTWLTKGGYPARGSIIGEFEGVKIKVVIEPLGEGIITAHPIQ